MDQTTRCIDCSTEFSDKQIQNVSACPNCGSQTLPCSVFDDVDIKINWQELRTIFMWAERWASARADTSPAMQTTLYSIAERVKRQCPEQQFLTFEDELQEFRKLNGVIEIEQNVIQERHPEGYSGPDMAPQ